MYSETTVLELVDLIYKAAGDPAGWSALLYRLAQVFGSNGISVHHHQIPSQESSFSGDWNIDPASISDYVNYYGLRNIWSSFRRRLFFAGSVNASQMMCPEEVFQQSEYYNDFLRRYDLFHCLVATLRDDEAAFSNLTIFRPKNAERFEDDESQLLRLLVPHLVRAFQLHDRIQGLENKANLLEEALNQVQAAIVLIDSCGRALFVNGQAGALFQQQRYIRLTPNGIRVAIPSEHKQLAGLIQSAIETGARRSCHPGGTMNLSRGASQRPLQVLVSPLRSEAVFLGKARPVAIIFITDPERKSSTAPETLQRLYSLTPAESRLAQLLASGNTLKETSEQLGVAMSTVRSQLKSLFAKTNTNRQSELMRLLLLCPIFPPGQDIKFTGDLYPFGNED